jgi:phosphatidate cytidylyltransferase
MRRLLTAAVGVPLALLATFRLPADWFFVLVLVVIGVGSLEYVRLLKPLAPSAPLWLVPVWVVPAAGAAFWVLSDRAVPDVEAWLLVVGLFFTVGLGALVLASGMPAAEVPVALGVIGFGVPYFALPIACLAALQRLDPWFAALLYLIVWLGDAAAYYVGSAFGRHKMAPRVSPNKSWEGAAAGFAIGIVATLVWSVWRHGEVDPALLLVAALTAVAAQAGDLFESLFKRAVNVKDSGALLPGHGGMFDRMDALLFAAPVLLAGLWLIAHGGVAL